MIDPKLLRTDPDAVAANLARRGFVFDVAAFKALEEQRKSVQIEVDRLRAERNTQAKAVGKAKASGQDVAPLIAKSEALAVELESQDARLGTLQRELEALQLGLPNLLHDTVPEGRDESANQEVRRWGEPKPLDFEPRDHVALGEALE